MTKRSWSAPRAWASALGILLLGVACGGGSSPSGESSPGGPVAPLTVGVGSASTNYGSFWIAMTTGLFAKNGVTVNVSSYNTGVATSSLVASGQVDLELYTIPLGLQVAAQGKPVSYVFQIASLNSASGAVISAKNITSISQLQTMGSNCRIANPGAGSVLYAYSIKFAKAFNLGCQQIGEASVPAEVSVTASGNVQAAVVPYNVGLSAVQAGQANLLLDPTTVSPGLKKQFGTTTYPAYAVFGQKAAVQSKSASVVRFIKALRQANAQALKATPEELAKDCTTLPEAFGTSSVAALAPAWQATQLTLLTGSNAGFISKSDWDNALNGFSSWGIPNYDPKAASISYSSVVDMSYFNKSG